MINCLNYLNVLQNHGISFFTGVPDSLLKEFCSCLDHTVEKKNHIIASNEGAAVGLGIGNYIGSKNLPLVYMQNSGLGNAINPLLSLASPEVYATPMILMIGWRGEPGQKDEPQHVHQGKVMIPMLESMKIPTTLLSYNEKEAIKQTEELISKAKEINGAVALIIRKNTFDSFYNVKNLPNNSVMSREDAIICTLKNIEKNACVICTTGMASRELFEFRTKTGDKIKQDFLTVGGMGHSSQIALGLAITQTKLPIYCFDGDGAVLMHMGSMGIIGQSKQKNLVHVVLNNGAHDSVGGQPTVCSNIKLYEIAKACGYNNIYSVKTKEKLIKSIIKLKSLDGPTFLEIRVKPGNRSNISRPSTTPKENKIALMNFLLNSE